MVGIKLLKILDAVCPSFVEAGTMRSDFLLSSKASRKALLELSSLIVDYLDRAELICPESVVNRFIWAIFSLTFSWLICIWFFRLTLSKIDEALPILASIICITYWLSSPFFGSVWKFQFELLARGIPCSGIWRSLRYLAPSIYSSNPLFIADEYE